MNLDDRRLRIGDKAYVGVPTIHGRAVVTIVAARGNIATCVGEDMVTQHIYVTDLYPHPMNAKYTKEEIIMEDLKDMYKVVDGVPTTTFSEIIKCKRSKEGERHYTIRYKGAGNASGSVRHSDIPSLIAALLDVYEGSVTDPYDEIPF